MAVDHIGSKMAKEIKGKIKISFHPLKQVGFVNSNDLAGCFSEDAMSGRIRIKDLVFAEETGCTVAVQRKHNTFLRERIDFRFAFDQEE